MTDIMKLADDYAAKNRAVANVIEQGTSGELIEADGDKKRARAALQSAIEALQEENALLEGTLESRGRNIAEMQAENERLKVESTNKNDWLVEQRKWEAHANALQAKLDAMGKGEPVAYDDKSCADMPPRRVMERAHGFCPTELPHLDRMAWMADYFLRNYAAPKALAPLTDEQCDQVAAQTMDAVAKARDMHALDLNPNIQEHHTLRRELIRAGFAIGIGG